MSNDPIYIGVAWPYANGALHLGHVAGSLLPPDIFRRFMRMAGHDVLMVSGSDCHGTPILLKAEEEGVEPAEVVSRYHKEHVQALARLGIGFDLFTATTTENHMEWVQRIFTTALEQGYIEKRTMQAPFDPKADRFLPDRYVEGTCPHCGNGGARGDQCDECGKTLDPHELEDPHSKLNPETAIEFRDTDHYFFLLSRLQPLLERYVSDTAAHWRPNTLKFTKNWLQEGLQDRAITRDLTWGIPIPRDGYEDKRIYVWFEAVCGYLTASVEWARRAASDDWDGIAAGGANLPAGIPGARKPEDEQGWKRWWCDPNTKAYYFLGKDNIPFHTIIWPGILTAFNAGRIDSGEEPLVLPFDVPANEFLNLGGEQFSKSRGIGIWVDQVLDRFDADAVRYYLAVNMPEQRDADWVWDDFFAKINDELVGTIGNLIHRVLSFTHKNLGEIPRPPPEDDALDRAVVESIKACADEMSLHLGSVRLKKAVRRFLEFAGEGNQRMQEVAPWKLYKDDPQEGTNALYSLLRLVKACAIFMAPYMPHAAERTWKMLQEPGSVHDATWEDATAPLQSGAPLQPPQALFRKLDPSDIPGNGQDATEDGTKTPKKDSEGGTTVNTDTVTIDDFGRIELRLAVVRSVEMHPDADKLMVLRLDVGDLGERQVVAGLKEFYDPSDLEGQTVAFVANLKPVKLRGVESQGMILAADHDGSVAVLNPEKPLPAGARIR